MVSPTLGVALLTVLVNARSACCGVSVALALLLAVLGSNWSEWLIVAVLVAVFGLITCACRVSVAAAVVSTWPTVHKPVVALYPPWLGVADTSASPVGSRSVI